MVEKMKVIFIILALLISCTTLAATKTATITCYAASDDKDKDGYARAGAVSKDFRCPNLPDIVAQLAMSLMTVIVTIPEAQFILIA